MKRILTAILLMAALMMPVSSAGAATPQAKQLKILQKQVKALQTQVKTLQAQMKSVNVVASVNWTATTCATAMTADLFQATWGVINNPAFSTVLTPAVTDYDACSNLKLTRGTALAMDWTGYNSLIAFLYGP